MPATTTLVAGSYERFLFGYHVFQEPAPLLERRFTHAAHKGVVKCVATGWPYVASGGADDTIHLFNLQGGKDLGFLMNPGQGALTALTFHTPSRPAASPADPPCQPTHLLSGSADGSISIWHAGGAWECMKTMHAHRREVTGISVHPSGLLALSVGRDSCLRLWNLAKGRCTFTTKLGADADGVQFSPCGTQYAVLMGSTITLHAVDGEPGTLRTLSHPRRALCMAWLPGSNSKLLVGSEDGSLRLWDTLSGAELICLQGAHTTRIRALAVSLMSGNTDGALLAATAATDGIIKVWHLSSSPPHTLRCLGEARTGARLTCLSICAASLPSPQQQQKRKAQPQQQPASPASAAVTRKRKGGQPDASVRGPKRQEKPERKGSKNLRALP